MGEKLSDVVVRLYRRVRRSVRVGVSALVSDYDPATQTVRAAPSVIEHGQSGAPGMDGVPVLWPGGSLRGLTMGLEDDDGAVLLVRHRSHDEVDGGTTALPANPQASRTMSYADAVALPGYVPPGVGRPSSQQRSDGQPVLYMPSGEALHVAVATASIALARADLVLSELQSIKAAFDLHTHTGVTTGPGVSGAPAVPLPSPSSVATDRILVDS